MAALCMRAIFYPTIENNLRRPPLQLVIRMQNETECARGGGGEEAKLPKMQSANAIRPGRN